MRPLDSAVAPLGVTQMPAAIPTGATNGGRRGMEEFNQNTIVFITFEDRMNRIFRIKKHSVGDG